MEFEFDELDESNSDESNSDEFDESEKMDLLAITSIWQQFNSSYELLSNLYIKFIEFFSNGSLAQSIYTMDFSLSYVKYQNIKEIYKECKLIFSYENSPGDYNIVLNLIKPIFKQIELIHPLIDSINLFCKKYDLKKIFNSFNFIAPTEMEYYKIAYLNTANIDKESYMTSSTINISPWGVVSFH